MGMESDNITIWVNRRSKALAVEVVPSGQMFELNMGKEIATKRLAWRGSVWQPVVEINMDTRDATAVPRDPSMPVRASARKPRTATKPRLTR